MLLRILALLIIKKQHPGLTSPDVNPHRRIELIRQRLASLPTVRRKEVPHGSIRHEQLVDAATVLLADGVEPGLELGKRASLAVGAHEDVLLAVEWEGVGSDVAAGLGDGRLLAAGDGGGGAPFVDGDVWEATVAATGDLDWLVFGHGQLDDVELEFGGQVEEVLGWFGGGLYCFQCLLSIKGLDIDLRCSGRIS